MDLKKFKLNLESTLGKRLEKVSKDMLTCKLDLEKVKCSLKEINNYVERKNYHRVKRHSIYPKTQSQPVLPTVKDIQQKIIRKPQEENKQIPVIKGQKEVKNTEPEVNGVKNLPSTLEQFLKTIKKARTTTRKVPEIPIDQVNTLIKDIESHYSPETLNNKPPFNISLGGKSAFDIIKGMNKDCFRLTESPDKRIIWSLGLVYELLGEEFNPDSSTAKSHVQDFLNFCIESPNISEFLMDVSKSFDFSDKNVDAVEEYIKGKEDLLAPQIYTQVSQLCGLMMVSLREAVVYAGLIKGKSPVWRIYSRLQYKKAVMEGRA